MAGRKTRSRLPRMDPTAAIPAEEELRRLDRRGRGRCSSCGPAFLPDCECEPFRRCATGPSRRGARGCGLRGSAVSTRKKDHVAGACRRESRVKCEAERRARDGSGQKQGRESGARGNRGAGAAAHPLGSWGARRGLSCAEAGVQWQSLTCARRA
jgi:hypothetical protein